MGILDKLFSRNRINKFANCIAIMARGGTETEIRQALDSKVFCPSCRQSFRFEKMVQLQGDNMFFVCPSCKSVEAQIKRS